MNLAITLQVDQFYIEYLEVYRGTMKMRDLFWDFDDPAMRAMNQAGRIVRDRIRREYAYAIPTLRVLEVIAKYSPIVEMGAGSGYWAYLLRQMGVSIEAYDSHPPQGGKNTYLITKAWTGVLEGRPGKLKNRPDHTLFLCWPPYGDPMAYDSLRAYTGRRLLYIGEHDGVTGDEAFRALLDKEWSLLDHEDIPQWPNLWDRLWIYERS